MGLKGKDPLTIKLCVYLSLLPMLLAIDPLFLSTLVCLVWLGGSMGSRAEPGQGSLDPGQGQALSPGTHSSVHVVTHHPYLLSFSLVTLKFPAV